MGECIFYKSTNLIFGVGKFLITLLRCFLLTLVVYLFYFFHILVLCISHEINLFLKCNFSVDISDTCIVCILIYKMQESCLVYIYIYREFDFVIYSDFHFRQSRLSVYIYLYTLVIKTNPHGYITLAELIIIL